MNYFSNDFHAFFKDLASNNNRDWFQANKKRYEKNVKKPFYAFLEDLIAEVKKVQPEIDLLPKNCVARINRDIRFSKDKTPYNLHYSGFVSKGGRKDSKNPGIAFRMSPEGLWIMGGCYALDKDQLLKFRRELARNPKKIDKLIADKSFSSKFDGIKGEVNKRIDKEFTDAAAKVSLIFNKQFYFMAERSPKIITSKNLMKEIMDHWHAAKPMNDYFASILN